jgi:para-aminobenzoate synthetase / 4-amino-4-deoxychorismate lyase
VFETLLVAGGKPVELEAHLARLAASTRALYGEEPPPTAEALVREAAGALELGRLRLDVAPGEDARVKVAEVEPAAVFPSSERAVELAEVVVPGGIGGHKWSDRRLLDRAQADLGEAVPLVVDDDGAVLEVSRGNVFAVRDGALVTPAADGRLLPGIARARVLDLAAELGLAAEERVLSTDELAQADEIFLTGSVRGVEPVRGREGDVSAAVRDALRRRWLGAQKPDYTRAP